MHLGLGGGVEAEAVVVVVGREVEVGAGEQPALGNKAVLALLRLKPVSVFLAAGGRDEDLVEVAVPAEEQRLPVLKRPLQGTDHGGVVEWRGGWVVGG